MDLLLELEKKYPGIFLKIMTNFDKAKLYKYKTKKDGKLITITWQEAFIKYYKGNKYIGVTSENEDIAELYGSKGLEQNIFDEAISLMKKAKAHNIPAHLLGEPLKETVSDLKKAFLKQQSLYPRCFFMNG